MPYKKPLDLQLNCCVLTMAACLFPKGYDIADTAPNTLDELVQHVNATGRMLVWSGASNHTIYGCPEVNWAFRAWHDHIHLRDINRYQFDMLGELGTCEEHYHDIAKKYDDSMAREMAPFIHAEIYGQAKYRSKFDEFPEDQATFVKAFLLFGEDYALGRKYPVH